MSFKKNHVDIISMGCSKNLIDSERLIRRLQAKGYSVTHNPETPEGEYVVVNTCGFIGDAKEESINLLLELGNLKDQNSIGSIVAMGCLTERYFKELESELPEIDKLYGKFDWDGFVNELPDLKSDRRPAEWERTLTTPPHSAYLKISEGCNRFCAFCAIPLITGRHKSRPIEEILEEVKTLTKEGVKEFNVIAQDLSSYGLDRYGRHALAELIDRMADIEGVEWIRLHYAYPADFPYDVLDVMAQRENVCKYLDIALQHISDSQLSRMRRHIDKEGTLKLLEKIREKVPGIKLRTTLMVGFPGETEEDFEELLEFVKHQQFDRLGAFAYSEEDDTYGALHYEDDVPESVKQLRLDKLMAVQQDISEKLNSAQVGSKVKLLVDEYEGDVAICRSQWDSPEVDLTYRVSNTEASPGEMIEAVVTEALPFDFIAEEVKP
ncbi:MAG: 30S ribosomal protein S12 methylthiotransferase RimO [Bacteroidales bacterium]|nr:30S ribosomal protein S12 methylthiotransferase RimO [Bacteroidales bacterium]MBD5223679.1 30S ribosomal protein S12 methylthiotransferase RimO [Bacteroidales bacterium]